MKPISEKINENHSTERIQSRKQLDMKTISGKNQNQNQSTKRLRLRKQPGMKPI